MNVVLCERESVADHVDPSAHCPLSPFYRPAELHSSHSSYLRADTCSERTGLGSLSPPQRFKSLFEVCPRLKGKLLQKLILFLIVNCKELRIFGHELQNVSRIENIILHNEELHHLYSSPYKLLSVCISASCCSSIRMFVSYRLHTNNYLRINSCT
jgi:hypothetical protein